MATTTFNDLITFSRGSNATVTGPNGLIQWAPNNLLTNSQDFEASAWTKGAGATVVANNQAAPDGTTTADTITFTAGGAAEFVRGFTTMVVGLVYTVSVYARRVSGTPNFVFDVGNSAAVSGTQVLSTSWQRLTFTFTFSGANQWVDLEATAAGSIAFWGAQLELGSTATTYNNTSVRNLLGFSEAFDNAAWTKVNSSIVTGAVANPLNGLFNAQKLMEDTVNTDHRLTYPNAVTTVGTSYTYSIYAKAAGRSYLSLYFNAEGKGKYFDLANGSVLGDFIGAPTSASITPVGNGWYRCSVTVSATTTSTNVRVYLSTNGSSYIYTGDGNSGVYIYGAMLSNSASLDPYVPTPGAAPSSTAYYGPRFDYDPVTLAARGLLVEEARTNLLTYSDQFNDASWLKARASVVANTAVGPDGLTSADKLVEDTANNTHAVYKPSGIVSGTNTFSVYAKPDGRNWLCLETDTVNTRSFFNIATGTLGTIGSAVTATITPARDGWYRCTITGTFVGTMYILTAASDGGAVYAGNGTSGILIYGAQAEAGAFATSYIPTIASTVTRSADVATISGSLFSQWYNQSEGAFIVEVTAASGVRAGSQGLFSVNDGTTSNVMNGARLATRIYRFNGTGSPAGDVSSVATISDSSTVKVSSAYKANDWAVSLNGATAVTDTTAVVPSANRLGIGSLDGLFDAAAQWGGHIRSIRYVPVRAADFQLQQVTT